LSTSTTAAATASSARIILGRVASVQEGEELLERADVIPAQ
jgi:hypothetical protein